jgi:hypothetical protein
MALNLSPLKLPVSNAIVDPATGVLRADWEKFLRELFGQVNQATGALSTDPAPAAAEYVVASADATLSAERVATDTTTIDVDMGTAAQARWNVKEVPGIAATGMVARTAAATYAARTITAGTGISVSNGDGVAGNPTISSTQLMTLGRRAIADITSGGTITTSDRAVNVVIQSGTGTLAFDDVATFAADFYCLIQNAGDGVVTLDPNSTQQIDGATSWALYPGGVILAQIASSAWQTTLLKPMTATLTASGTLVKPRSPNIKRGHGMIWGAGGGGGRSQAGGAGGGGAGGGGTPIDLPISAFGNTETYTQGTGGTGATVDNTNGVAGGNSTLGTLATGYGGGAGGNRTGTSSGGGGGGGGGGVSGAGSSAPGGGSVAGAAGGEPLGGAAATQSLFGGGGGSGGVDGAAGNPGGNSVYGGGGGGGGSSGAAAGLAGGSSLFGGGGGAGNTESGAAGAGGVSRYAGNGAAGGVGTTVAGANGSAPAGGGSGSAGANAGSGARGGLRITFE